TQGSGTVERWLSQSPRVQGVGTLGRQAGPFHRSKPLGLERGTMRPTRGTPLLPPLLELGAGGSAFPRAGLALCALPHLISLAPDSPGGSLKGFAMFPKPKAALVPNTYAYESEPLVKPTGFREYDARWLLGKEINLMGVQALGLGLGTLIHQLGVKPE